MHAFRQRAPGDYVPLPFLTLHSDVRDVVCVSWLVDAAAAQQLLPAGATLWQRGGKTPFTVLT